MSVEETFLLGLVVSLIVGVPVSIMVHGSVEHSGLRHSLLSVAITFVIAGTIVVGIIRASGSAS